MQVEQIFFETGPRNWLFLIFGLILFCIMQIALTSIVLRKTEKDPKHLTYKTLSALVSWMNFFTVCVTLFFLMPLVFGWL